MGDLRKMIDGLDWSNETEREIAWQLENYLELGESQVYKFRSEIETLLKDGKTIGDLKFPVTKVVDSYEEYRAYTKREQKELFKDVSDSIQIMLSDDECDIKKGIASLLTKRLVVLFDTGSGDEKICREYYIVLESSNIVRYDVAIWACNVAEESIQERANNILSGVVYKSFVDVSELDFDIFLLCYCNVLYEACGGNATYIGNKIREARKVFSRLK